MCRFCMRLHVQVYMCVGVHVCWCKGMHACTWERTAGVCVAFHPCVWVGSECTCICVGQCMCVVLYACLSTYKLRGGSACMYTCRWVGGVRIPTREHVHIDVLVCRCTLVASHGKNVCGYVTTPLTKRSHRISCLQFGW